VTVVEKLELRASELERWAKSLKQDLGCGGVVEGRTIVIQGDQRGRAVTWLEAKGVRKITRG
jgi:translation initiation factor 1